MGLLSHRRRKCTESHVEFFSLLVDGICLTCSLQIHSKEMTLCEAAAAARRLSHHDTLTLATKRLHTQNIHSKTFQAHQKAIVDSLSCKRTKMVRHRRQTTHHAAPTQQARKTVKCLHPMTMTERIVKEHAGWLGIYVCFPQIPSTKRDFFYVTFSTLSTSV